MKVARFTKPARSELLAQTVYYETLQAGLGARFRKEGEATALRAAIYPLHGKPSAGSTERRLMSDIPFSVICTEIEYGILLHALADGRLLLGTGSTDSLEIHRRELAQIGPPFRGFVCDTGQQST